MEKILSLIFVLVLTVSSAMAEAIPLDMDCGEAEVYTAYPFCPEGVAKDFYFQFANKDSRPQLPYLEFDIYGYDASKDFQPGTYYFVHEGHEPAQLVHNPWLLLTAQDSQDYDKWQNNYVITDGYVTFTHKEGQLWNVYCEFSISDGVTFCFDLDLDLPFKAGGEGTAGVTDTFEQESINPSQHNILFTYFERSNDYVQTNNLVYFNMESTPAEGSTEMYVSEFYLRLNKDKFPDVTSRIPAGTYKVAGDNTDEKYSFVASHGDAPSGGRYPCYMGLFDKETRKFKNVWYITEGTITISYDQEGQMNMKGDLGSRFGSHLTFVYDASGTAGISAVTTNGSTMTRFRKQMTREGVVLSNGSQTFRLSGAQ